MKYFLEYHLYSNDKAFKDLVGGFCEPGEVFLHGIWSK